MAFEHCRPALSVADSILLDKNSSPEAFLTNAYVPSQPEVCPESCRDGSQKMQYEAESYMTVHSHVLFQSHRQRWAARGVLSQQQQS